MAINANAFVLCIQCFFPIQNEGKNPQIAELFANGEKNLILRKKFLILEKKTDFSKISHCFLQCTKVMQAI